MGSVKDLKIIKEATKDNLGEGRFTFSDRYSVFDWGTMPDNIPNKGSSIALLAAYFFEKLEKIGISTHYIGLVEENEVKRLSDIKNPTNIMEIKLLRVLKPEFKNGEYDYSIYNKEYGVFLIPLEIIYRNYLPEGSSIFKRLKSGEIKIEDIGMKTEPVPGQKLDVPILDISTKLEITDRYLTWKEAQKISGLSDDEISKLKEIITLINNLITQEFSKIGLVNEDGKIEVGFDNSRRLMVVDVFGTLDECRFTLDGLPVSKEIARIYYRDTKWYQDVEDAKKKDRYNWKSICRSSPEPMPSRLKELISQAYCACTNEITERKWFENVPDLKEILKEVKEIINYDK